MLSEKEQINDTAAFWKFIKLNFKVLFVYAICGGIAAFIVTLFIPKEYKSYGIVYPPSSTAIENSIDFPNFGYDVEADRLIQIIESREIRDSVVNKFDLVNQFEIKKTKAEWHDDLMKKYYKNIKLERTISMAVLITARTKDPELSADIVNYIIKITDQYREKLYKRNIISAYEHAEREYEFQKSKVDSAQKMLIENLKENNLSSLLMLMSDAQISIDIDKLNSVNVTSHENIGAQIIAFKGLYDLYREAKGRWVKTKKTVTNPIPKIYVINYAEPHYRKISPSFTVNVCVGAIFSLCIATIILLVRKSSEQV